MSEFSEFSEFLSFHVCLFVCWGALGGCYGGNEMCRVEDTEQNLLGDETEIMRQNE